MPLFFAIETEADITCGLDATLTRSQLDAFVAVLRADGQQLGPPPFVEDYPLESMLYDGFEARVCPIPIERIAPLFDNDPAVIAVIENARSRARKVVIWRERPPLRTDAALNGPIKICPYVTSDTDAELDIPTTDAHKLLACLGFDDWRTRECSVEDVRCILAQSSIREKIAAEGLAHIIPDLERLLATATDEPTARLHWH